MANKLDSKYFNMVLLTQLPLKWIKSYVLLLNTRGKVISKLPARNFTSSI